MQLESLLRAKFPTDTIEPVPKGEFGGARFTSCHRTDGATVRGNPLGIKANEELSDGWLAKLRDDQRAAKADTALIVSQVAAKSASKLSIGLREFGWLNRAAPFQSQLLYGIRWIESVNGLASRRRTANEDVELVYQYLNGPRFKHRVGAIVERFSGHAGRFGEGAKEHDEDVGKTRRSDSRRNRSNCWHVWRSARHCGKVISGNRRLGNKGIRNEHGEPRKSSDGAGYLGE